MPAAGWKKPNAGARPARFVDLPAYHRIKNVRHVTFARFFGGLAAKELGEKYLSKRLQHDGWRFCKDV
jgi:hypothetical protein